MMDTKMQALEKAQELFVSLLNDGKQPCITNVESATHGKYFSVSLVEINQKSIFEYSDPRPLEKDTYVFDKKHGIYRHASGELDTHFGNAFYPAGYCSLNIKDGVTGWAFLRDCEFEVIETPGEFERVQTPDEICRVYQCQHIREKHSRDPSIYGMHKPCLDCTILTVTPSKLKSEKR